MSAFTNACARQHNQRLEAACLRRGYYLVKGDARHFVSEHVDEAALNRVCDRVLSDAKGWNYWVDYSHGVSVTGAPAWENADQTDRFI